MNSKPRREFRDRDRDRDRRERPFDDSLFEKVVHIGRCSKVVSGGRRFSFSALVVVGNRNGSVGVGYGRANGVPEAVRKATDHARSAMQPFALKDGTIPHGVIGLADGGRVMLRPAAPGTGLIAGGGIRAVLEAFGAKNILSKSMRSNNALATVRATMNALGQLRTYETILALRGKSHNKNS
jgi:small subunit ribosomal protein S5